jgi:hypothetical protein
LKGISRLIGFLGTDAAEAVEGVPVAALQAARNAGMDAYELIDQLHRGPARLAAWNAYVLETYGDKLLGASVNPSHIRIDTAELALDAFTLAGWWVEQVSELSSNPAAPSDDHRRDPLPHFHTPVRSHEQLVGLRDTLDALRAYVAYDLESLQLDESSGAALRNQLVAVDKNIERASMLWIEDAPPEIRGGIGDALINGLDEAYALGQALATRG